MDNSPLSAMHEGARTTADGVFTFALGVVAGTTLTLFIASGHFTAWYWSPVAALYLVPYAIGKLWGFLLVPVYAVVFYGLVWSEWNRLQCFSVLAMATSVVMLISFEGNPFSNSGMTRRFLSVECMLSAMLAAGVLLTRARNGPAS